MKSKSLRLFLLAICIGVFSSCFSETAKSVRYFLPHFFEDYKYDSPKAFKFEIKENNISNYSFYYKVFYENETPAYATSPKNKDQNLSIIHFDKKGRKVSLKNKHQNLTWTYNDIKKVIIQKGFTQDGKIEWTLENYYKNNMLEKFIEYNALGDKTILSTFNHKTRVQKVFDKDNKLINTYENFHTANH